MGVIPFYGSEEPELFAIERQAMDRPGKVIAALDRLLPAAGDVLDVGAGTGFTAAALTTPARTVIPAEPAPGMWRPELPLAWTGAEAAHLPFRDSAFDAAYATWAYFFGDEACRPGLRELHRVVRAGGTLVIVDNAGDDEFTSLAPSNIATDRDFWRNEGFAAELVETVFDFDSEDDAHRLLTHYFGNAIPSPAPRILSYGVFVFVGAPTGP